MLGKVCKGAVCHIMYLVKAWLLCVYKTCERGEGEGKK